MVHKTQLLVVVAVVSAGLAPFVFAQSGTRGYQSPQGTQGSSTQQQGTQGSSSRPQGTQGSSTQQQGTQGSSSRSEAPFDDRFWNYLKQAQYHNWATLPGVPTAGYPGSSPHGDQVKLFVNRIAAAGGNGFDNGSILIKENYDASGKNLMAVTVMYRTTGYAPESGDWYWAKYEPNGRVSVMNNMRVSGRVGMCIECHRSAAGNDYVFANDGQ